MSNFVFNQVRFHSENKYGDKVTAVEVQNHDDLMIRVQSNGGVFIFSLNGKFQLSLATAHLYSLSETGAIYHGFEYGNPNLIVVKLTRQGIYGD